MKSLSEIREACRMVDGHWIWTGAVTSSRPAIWAPDYTIKDGGMRPQTGRRAVWHIRSKKPIPSGWQVFGTCEEPMCLAWNHMECRPFVEKRAEVAASGKWKGKVQQIAANRKTGRSRSRLTPELIARIHSSPKTGVALSEELGIPRKTISKVRRGRIVAFEPVGGLFTGLLRDSANESGRKAA